MLRKFIVAIICLVLLGFNKSFSQTDSILKNHVVIMVDGGVYAKPHKDVIINCILNEVKDYCTLNGKFIPNETLLKEGDYISFINYSILKEKDLNFNSFFHTNTDYASISSYEYAKSEEFGFISNVYTDDLIFNDISNRILNTKYFFIGSRWSIPKTAKTLVLDFLNKQIDLQNFNRLYFIIFENTKEFGVNSYIEEIHTLSLNYNTNSINNLLLAIDNDFLKLQEIPISIDSKNIRLTIYEYCPKTYDFNSTIIYPSEIKFTRKKEGFYYKLNLEKSSTANPQYIIKKFNIIITNSLKDTIVNQYFEQEIDSIPFSTEFLLPYHKNYEGLTGEIKFWVHNNYTFFKGFILNPYENGVQGEKLRHYLNNITLEDNAFLVTDNMYETGIPVWLWHLLFIVLFLAFILFLFWLIFIKFLKKNIDRGENAKINGDNEDIKCDNIEFKNEYENDFYFLANQKIEVTQRKIYIFPFWKYKVDYNHYILEPIIKSYTSNLIFDKKNLILFESYDVKKNNYNGVHITENVKGFKIGLNRAAILDNYGFKETNDEEKRIKIEIESYPQKDTNKSFAVYDINFKLIKQNADFELNETNFILSNTEGILFSDAKEYNNFQIGILHLENKSTKAFAQNLILNNIVIDDDRVSINSENIIPPYVFTIKNEELINLREKLSTEENKKLQKLENYNYLLEEELFNDLIFIKDLEIQKEITKIAKRIHPLFSKYFKGNVLNLVIPGKCKVQIPVCANITKIGNPDCKTKEIKFNISGLKEKEPFGHEFKFLLLRANDYSEMFFSVNNTELKKDENFSLERDYFWDKSQDKTTLLTLLLGNKAIRHTSNTGIKLQKFKIDFSTSSENILSQIVTENAADNLSDIFTVFNLNKELKTNNSIFEEHTFLNKDNTESYEIKINNKLIKEIPGNETNIICSVTYIYQGEQYKHLINLKIRKYLGDYWLALDMGTSAIVAAFTDDVHQKDTNKKLLDLQRSLYELLSKKESKLSKKESTFWRFDKENIEECNISEKELNNILSQSNSLNGNFFGSLLSSTLILNEDGEVDAKEYERNVVNISPTRSLIKNNSQNIVPYLKSLIGAKELEDNNYNAFKYYGSTLYFYDHKSYEILEKNLTNGDDLKLKLHILKEIKEQIGFEKFPQKLFRSKIRKILHNDYLYNKYKFLLIGEFSLPYEILKQKIGDNLEKLGELNKLKDKKFEFYSDYIHTIKNLLPYKVDENEIKAQIITDKNKNEIAKYIFRKHVAHKKESNTDNNRLEIRTILQNAYESIFIDFIYPQIVRIIPEHTNISDVLNKIVLTYPNTFSPLHIKYIKEDVILNQFPEFDKKHIKFISESDAVAIYGIVNLI